MSNPVLYVLPENHYKKEDVARRETLRELAAWGAINVLLEGVYFHDTDYRSVNHYGIEDEFEYEVSGVIVEQTKRVARIKGVNDMLWKDHTTEEVHNASKESHQKLTELADKKRFKKLEEGKRLRSEIETYVKEYPDNKHRKTYEKYVLYKRNHKMANNIREIVQLVLNDSNLPKVFALPVGASHVDVQPRMQYSEDFAERKALRTLLGERITATTEREGKRSTLTVEVKYGNTPLVEIAKKALELSGSLPLARRMQVTFRLGIYLSTGGYV